MEALPMKALAQQLNWGKDDDFSLKS